MESTERLKQKVLQEKRVANRLGWAQTRLEAAERERIWAIASAHARLVNSQDWHGDHVEF